MHSPSHQTRSPGSNTDFLRRYARRLLREIRSDQASRAMPVLRRVHAARVVPVERLTDLYRSRNTMQLKHMLHTLAAELGYANWDACKHDVDLRPPEALDRFRFDLGAFGDYEHIWFSDAPAARQWQQEHGGHVVVYGNQAVVMTV